MDDGQVQGKFDIVDYAIFSLVLLVSIAIGLYHACTGGRQRTTKEFLMANRQMMTLPVALSILVSFVSSILVLGTPAEMYTRGTQMFMRTFGYCLACILSSLLFVPLFFNLRVTSSFEYLELRYRSKAIKLFGVASMLLGNLFYMGLVLYTPATALEAVTGFPLWLSVIITGLVTTFYTTLGGLKAVIWTDVFQAGVMIGGILVILIQGIVNVGGLEKVWKISSDAGRINFFDFDLDPTKRLTFWSTVIGGTFSTLGIFGVGQMNVQRYCALPTLAQAQRSIYLNIPFLFIVNVLVSLVGLVIYAHYAVSGCDPLRNKRISNPNQLVPYYIVNAVNFPGLPGIFLAVLFSGSLSSLSSALNSAAAVTWQDILIIFGYQYNESRKALFTKLIVVAYGLIAMAVAMLTQQIGDHVLQVSLSFTGATIGPSLGLFLLGALFPVANWIGALVGAMLSSAFSLWLSVGTLIARPHRQMLPTSVANCSNSSNSTSWLYTESESLIYSNASSLSAYHTDVLETTTSTLFGIYPTGSVDTVGSRVGRLYELSFLWYSLIGCSMTLFIGLLVSAATRSLVERNDNPLVYIPLFDRLACCLPKRIRNKISCCGLFATSASSVASPSSNQNLIRERRSDVEKPSSIDTETTEFSDNKVSIIPLNSTTATTIYEDSYVNCQPVQGQIMSGRLTVVKL